MGLISLGGVAFARSLPAIGGMRRQRDDAEGDDDAERNDVDGHLSSEFGADAPPCPAPAMPLGAPCWWPAHPTRASVFAAHDSSHLPRCSTGSPEAVHGAQRLHRREPDARSQGAAAPKRALLFRLRPA